MCGGMASKGLRAIFNQVTRKAEVSYKPLQTTETLIGYTAYQQLFFLFQNHFFQ